MNINHLIFHFVSSSNSALRRFPNTVALCTGLCAYISRDLKKADIKNEVVLGSLNYAGIDLFPPQHNVIKNSSSVKIDIPGHAWIEFPNNIIGEPS